MHKNRSLSRVKSAQRHLTSHLTVSFSADCLTPNHGGEKQEMHETAGTSKQGASTRVRSLAILTSVRWHSALESLSFESFHKQHHFSRTNTPHSLFRTTNHDTNGLITPVATPSVSLRNIALEPQLFQPRCPRNYLPVAIAMLGVELAS